MVDDYTPRTPQDDLEEEDDATIDPVMLENHEDITQTLHVSPEERRERLEDNENPDLEQSEDTREELEDRDQET